MESLCIVPVSAERTTFLLFAYKRARNVHFGRKGRTDLLKRYVFDHTAVDGQIEFTRYLRTNLVRMLPTLNPILAQSWLSKLFDPTYIETFLKNIHPWEYVVLFLIIFAESGILIGFFFPGDTLLVTAGILANTGSLNIYILVPLFFIAAFLGDQVGYFTGHFAGERFFQNEDAKILKKSHIKKTHDFFEKYGPKTIVLARFVPIVRTLAPVMAGTAKMKYRTFIIFNAVGAILWGIGITLLGYFLGKTIGPEKVDKYLYPILAIILLLSFLPPFIEWRRKKRHEKKSA